MAIKIYQDKIEFVDGASTYTLTETAEGFDFSGSLASSNFSVFLGTVDGYTSGGYGGGSFRNTIDKFPFSTDTNATDVGDLLSTYSFYSLSGQSSPVSGYVTGGEAPGPTHVNVIQKFPFSTNANSSDVGDLSNPLAAGAGCSSDSYGYVAGGISPAFIPTEPSNGYTNIVQRFSFAVDGNSSDVGDMLLPGAYSHGVSSLDHGYILTGRSAPNPVLPSVNQNVIQRFPFATNSNTSDVGDAIGIAGDQSGVSSGPDFGYISGITPGSHNHMAKFPYASSAFTTRVVELLGSFDDGVGLSSTTNGYLTGPSGPAGNVIQKWPFAYDGKSTDVGDLTQVRRSGTSQQN